MSLGYGFEELSCPDADAQEGRRRDVLKGERLWQQERAQRVQG